VTAGRLSLRPRAAAGALLSVGLCLLPLLGGCARTVTGTATAAPTRSVPAAPDQLGQLVVTSVPSGLPRLPDRSLTPPAGAKTVRDVAAYAKDPEHEQQVLEDYGYRFGWERFWGSGAGDGPVTSVFVDEFQDRAGASAYARDLAGNDAEYYRGMLQDNPPGLPGGCSLLTVDQPDQGLTGPAAFAWCGHGVFSVSVTAVADTPEAAAEEAHAVLQAQLDLLPPR
jgi:hypothetical protein